MTDIPRFDLDEAYIRLALHEIENKRGPQRESIQVFREFYLAMKGCIERDEASRIGRQKVVGWVLDGEFCGFSVPFGHPAKAAYVEFRGRKWVPTDTRQGKD